MRPPPTFPPPSGTLSTCQGAPLSCRRGGAQSRVSSSSTGVSLERAAFPGGIAVALRARYVTAQTTLLRTARCLLGRACCSKALAQQRPTLQATQLSLRLELTLMRRQRRRLQPFVASRRGFSTSRLLTFASKPGWLSKGSALCEMQPRLRRLVAVAGGGLRPPQLLPALLPRLTLWLGGPSCR